MNCYHLTVVALRLMSIHWLLGSAIQLGPLLIQLIRSNRGLLDEAATFGFLPWSLLAVSLFASLGLWVFASDLARMASRGTNPDIPAGSISASDGYSIAFVGIGMFYVISDLPHILNWIHYLFRAALSHPGSSWEDPIPWYDVSQPFMRFTAAVLLVIKARSWADRLVRRATPVPLPPVT